MNDEVLDLPREQYEPVISQPVELEYLGEELTLSVFDLDGTHEIRTCYGDVCKTVNALRNYSRLLEMVCDTWGLSGFHRATYECHAEKLREIAGKLQAGIGYDYDAAVEKCRKKREKKQRDDDVGGEAMEMAFLRSKREADAKARKAAGHTGDEADQKRHA